MIVFFIQVGYASDLRQRHRGYSEGSCTFQSRSLVENCIPFQDQQDNKDISSIIRPKVDMTNRHYQALGTLFEKKFKMTIVAITNETPFDVDVCDITGQSLVSIESCSLPKLNNNKLAPENFQLYFHVNHKKIEVNITKQDCIESVFRSHDFLCNHNMKKALISIKVLMKKDQPEVDYTVNFKRY